VIFSVTKIEGSGYNAAADFSAAVRMIVAMPSSAARLDLLGFGD